MSMTDEQVVRELRRGWGRIKDIATAANGPEECLAFQAAAKAENGKCVETVIRYLNGLVDRLAKVRTERDDLRARVGVLEDALQRLSHVCTCTRPPVSTPSGGWFLHSSAAPGPHTAKCVSTIAQSALAPGSERKEQ